MPLKKRPEALYELFVNAKKKELTLERLMQHGDEELPDFQEFLALWIAFLGMKTGSDADRLIAEAIGLLNHFSEAVEYAKKYAAVHPGLYLTIVKSAMKYSEEEKDSFFELFSQWKSMTRMAPDTRTCAIEKIEKLLAKRTKGIMDANRRHYYGECAAYIAALGEVQESFGEAGAKQRIMTVYKERYSRRSAFRAEMENYGWKSGRGKR